MSRKAKAQFALKRFRRFFLQFLSSKRAMLGITILVLYILFAVLAPLFTPNDPVRDWYVAGDLAKPSWFRTTLGDNSLSENFQLVAKPGFNNPASIQEWNFQTSAKQIIFEQYSSSIGCPVIGSFQGSGPGSLAVTLKRDKSETPYNQVKAYITKQFSYSSSGAPGRFHAQMSILVEGTSTFTSNNAMLDAPVDIKVFIERIDPTPAGRYDIWPTPGQSGVTSYPSLTWVPPKIDSNFLKAFFINGTLTMGFPERTIFTGVGNYVFGVELLFNDRVSNKSVETTVFVDDLNFNILGTSYGVLGTDHNGRDVFSQLLHGARVSLFVGLLSAILGVTLGLIVGLVAGYVGGLMDEGLMRFADMLLVLPELPLLLVLVAVLGATIFNLILLIGFLGWMGFARTVRSQVLSLRERPFIEASKAVGAGKFYIILRHILPNVMSLVYVSLAMAVPGAILAEAALSWLGFFDPNVMSWGRMLHDVEVSAAIGNWWWVVPPGLSIALISLSFILLGYALDEVLNPKLRVRR